MDSVLFEFSLRINAAYSRPVVFKWGATAPGGYELSGGALASKQSDGGVEIVKGALEQLH